MRLSTKAATGATAATLLLIFSGASAQAQTELETYQKGANWGISGNAGYDPTLPSLQGDTYIVKGAPLEGESWYDGHGGDYGADYEVPMGNHACMSFPDLAANSRRFYECVDAVERALGTSASAEEACKAAALSSAGGEASRQAACVAAVRAQSRR